MASRSNKRDNRRQEPKDEDSRRKKNSSSIVVVVIERTGTTNGIRVAVNGMLEMDVKAVPITAEDDQKHGYRIPTGDTFAHLAMQFKFAGLTDKVEGILDDVSTAKKGVAMPMMGGEDRYRTLSFLATDCTAYRFRRRRRRRCRHRRRRRRSRIVTILNLLTLVVSWTPGLSFYELSCC